MRMTITLEWNGDDLGPRWMNPDNLAHLMFTETKTLTKLIKVLPKSVIYQEVSKDE